MPAIAAGAIKMKAEIHPDYGRCSNCHPYYTGQQRLVDTAGRVDRFKRKYGIK